MPSAISKAKDSIVQPVSQVCRKLFGTIEGKFLVSAILTASVILIKHRAHKRRRIAHHEMKKAHSKRAARDEILHSIVIPTVVLSEELKTKILNADVVELLEMLKAQTVTSQQILTAYFERAKTLGVEYNLLADVNFEEALAAAIAYDNRDKSSPSRGLLDGIPISIKDCFPQRGLDNTLGVAHRASHPREKDGIIVRLVREEGGIPFIRSSTSQILIGIENCNHIWGEAKNPWNKLRTTGGSSGGEAGLVAARCSPIGFGSDFEGSVRIPPLWCGICGFKPSTQRSTNKGLTVYRYHAIQPVVGPIAKTVRDLNLMMKVLSSEKIRTFGPHEGDPYYKYTPWNDEEFNSTYKKNIGYIKSHPYFPASTANQRAVEIAVQALKELGHEVIEVELPAFQELSDLLVKDVFSSNLKDIINGLNNEDPCDKLAGLSEVANMSRLRYWVTKQLLKLKGENRLYRELAALGPITTFEYLCTVGQQQMYKLDFLAFWEKNKLDGLIIPGTPCPAIRHGGHKSLPAINVYTRLFNVLDYPCGVLPITVVQDTEQAYPYNADTIDRGMKETMAAAVGLPVGVQVATLPGQEEKCLSIMREIEEQVQFRDKHPFPL